MRKPFFLAALCLLAGCATFREVQVDAFLDDDGRVLMVRYGVMSRNYTYPMVSPVNGAVIEGYDNRVVKVSIPEPFDKEVTCRICQKYTPKGTMYKSKDKDWLYWTIGTRSRLYLYDPSPDIQDYVEVFNGKFYPPASGQGGLL